MFRNGWRLFRPFTLLAPMVAAFLFGFLAVREWRWEFVISAVALAGANASGNVLNQIVDVDIDKESKPDRPLPSGVVTRDEAWLVAVLLYGGTIFLSSFLSLDFKIIILIILGFTLLYSAPPVYWKRKFVLNNLAIATPRGGLGIIAAYAAFSSVPLWMWGAGLCFALYVFAANTSKDFGDELPDRMHGVRNFVTVLGPETAERVMLSLKTVSFLLFALFAFLGMFRFSPFIIGFGIGLNWVLSKKMRKRNAAWHFFYIEYALLMMYFVWAQL